MNIGLDKKVCKTVVDHLNLLLAQEFALYIKTLNCHWNVYGKHFGALHLFFKGQYEELLDIVDDVAERVVTLDGHAAATVIEIHKNTVIPEKAQAHLNDMQLITDLMKAHEIVIKQIRKDIDLTVKLNDMGTNNFLCDLIEKHEKMTWMLRAHIAE
ncbi:MAG: DNA starvation/stationary phase protection protein [Candidatus Babeliales bacterium]